jgi:DNA replication protein DnaC
VITFHNFRYVKLYIKAVIETDCSGTGSAIITSNRPAEDWFSVFPDRVISGAVLGRIASGAQKIIVEKAKSYRKYGLSKPKQFTKDQESV